MSGADLASAIHTGHEKYILCIVGMKNQVHLIRERIKEIELKCRVLMEAALNILLTKVLCYEMLKCDPKADQYEKTVVFSLHC